MRVARAERRAAPAAADRRRVARRAGPSSRTVSSGDGDGRPRARRRRRRRTMRASRITSSHHSRAMVQRPRIGASGASRRRRERARRARRAPSPCGRGRRTTNRSRSAARERRDEVREQIVTAAVDARRRARGRATTAIAVRPPGPSTRRGSAASTARNVEVALERRATSACQPPTLEERALGLGARRASTARRATVWRARSGGALAARRARRGAGRGRARGRGRPRRRGRCCRARRAVARRPPIPSWPGTTARIPPETPLLAGRPTVVEPLARRRRTCRRWP